MTSRFPRSLAVASGCTLFSVALSACQTPGQTKAVSRPTEAVTSLLVGSYSSVEQAKADRDYREILLHMTRIWPTRTDGPWIYVEQALASEPARPYRQRVYQVAETTNPDAAPGTIESRVFELPGDPLEFAGAWKEPARFSSISVEQLVPRDGCTVYLVPNDDGSWSGGTDGTGCSSALRGATYATSEVTLNATEIRSWDRGFDKDGKQAWGAEKGAYIFRRDATKADAKSAAVASEPQERAKEIAKPFGIR